MLQGENLAAFRGERLVFSGLDFCLGAGEALLLAGSNGSGKSTLLRLLAGLLRPAAGALRWQGADTLAEFSDHAARVAYLGHQDAIKPALSVVANLRLGTDRAAGLPALQAMGLGPLADFPARLLSAGQRRRLALARLALTPRQVWLLDEPTLGLDDASMDRLGILAAQHLAQGRMIVAATHLPLPFVHAAELRLGR